MKNISLMSKKFITKYWHFVFVLYTPIYLYTFFTLENMAYKKTTIIHMPLDDMIPFCKYFIIPYLIWFIYIFAAIAFFFFYSRREFIRYASFLIIGMSVCLAIYALFPSELQLRPVTVDTSDIFGYLVNIIYRTDTPTNVCPSIHCLNSFATHIAILKCGYFRKRPALIRLSFILMVMICLSTLFLKQHSVYDVMGAALLAVILYVIIYKIFPPAKDKELRQNTL
ncbi:MAG: phosphatase PAP2 family protein [Lachnospiraceae bacterium]|nr:phosphatase PAP2 family protein [Lachnospiraceae bacterium]